MDAIDVNRTIDLLSLTGDLTCLRKAGAYHVSPCPFCGGRDRFTIKHTAEGDRWHCRQCGDGKYHTAIDFVMKRDNCDFRTAMMILAGQFEGGGRNAATREAAPQFSLPSPAWQDAAWLELHATNERLWSEPGDAEARSYLASRGLHKGTWAAWLLGSAMIGGHSALVIPWLDMSPQKDIITALKYRFLRNGKRRRFAMRKGSQPLIFGLQHVLESDQTLLIVEGELNALSIWQCLPAGIAVVSTGSEGGGSLAMLQQLARRFEHVFVWMDDVWDEPRSRRRAQELNSIIRGKGLALRSVMHDGMKLDANQLLKTGELRDFLSATLNAECLGICRSV
jgi:DNA primase